MGHTNETLLCRIVEYSHPIGVDHIADNARKETHLCTTVENAAKLGRESKLKNRTTIAMPIMREHMLSVQ